MPRRDGDRVTFAAAREPVATFEVVAGKNLRIPVAAPPDLAPDKKSWQRRC